MFAGFFTSLRAEVLAVFRSPVVRIFEAEAVYDCETSEVF